MHPREGDGIHASSIRQLLRTTQRDAYIDRSTCTRGTDLALHKASRSERSRPKQETTMYKLISRMRIPASSGSAMLRTSEDHGIAVPRLADGESIEIDANGSPVTLEAAEWLVCFVPGLRKQWWHALVNAKHKHVFAMRMVDENTWLIMEPWWTRNMINVLSFDQAVKYLHWAAAGDIIKVREAVPGRGSQMRGWSNCAVMVSFLLGRRYRTWSPHGLYKRLKAEQGAQIVDVPRLLVDHCATVATRAVGAVLGAFPRRQDEPLESVLSRIGQGMVRVMLTPAVIGIHKAAASGSRIFTKAAEAYRANGPDRVSEQIRRLLDEADRRGEIRMADSALAARRFISMLRGDLHVAAGVRADALPEMKISDYVNAVVAAFLSGTHGTIVREGLEAPLQKELAY